jgi:hypothetical protein
MKEKKQKLLLKTERLWIQWWFDESVWGVYNGRTLFQIDIGKLSITWWKD